MAPKKASPEQQSPPMKVMKAKTISTLVSKAATVKSQSAALQDKASSKAERERKKAEVLEAKEMEEALAQVAKFEAEEAARLAQESPKFANSPSEKQQEQQRHEAKKRKGQEEAKNQKRKVDDASNAGAKEEQQQNQSQSGQDEEVCKQSKKPKTSASATRSPDAENKVATKKAAPGKRKAEVAEAQELEEAFALVAKFEAEESARLAKNQCSGKAVPNIKGSPEVAEAAVDLGGRADEMQQSDKKKKKATKDDQKSNARADSKGKRQETLEAKEMEEALAEVARFEAEEAAKSIASGNGAPEQAQQAGKKTCSKQESQNEKGEVVEQEEQSPKSDGETNIAPTPSEKAEASRICQEDSSHSDDAKAAENIVARENGKRKTVGEPTTHSVATSSAGTRSRNHLEPGDVQACDNRNGEPKGAQSDDMCDVSVKAKPRSGVKKTKEATEQLEESSMTGDRKQHEYEKEEEKREESGMKDEACRSVTAVDGVQVEAGREKGECKNDQLATGELEQNAVSPKAFHGDKPKSEKSLGKEEAESLSEAPPAGNLTQQWLQAARLPRAPTKDLSRRRAKVIQSGSRATAAVDDLWGFLPGMSDVPDITKAVTSMSEQPKGRRAEDEDDNEHPMAESMAELATDPTPESIDEPMAESTAEPTAAEPTAELKVDAPVEPTAEPTIQPTAEPTAEPTVDLLVEPTAEPSMEPTAAS